MSFVEQPCDEAQLVFGVAAEVFFAGLLQRRVGLGGHARGLRCGFDQHLATIIGVGWRRTKPRASRRSIERGHRCRRQPGVARDGARSLRTVPQQAQGQPLGGAEPVDLADGLVVALRRVLPADDRRAQRFDECRLAA